jgi:hypothetical protein
MHNKIVLIVDSYENDMFQLQLSRDEYYKNSCNASITIILVTYSKVERPHMRSQVLFDGSTRSKLTARCDLPEPHGRVGADPSMDLKILVLA